MCIHALISSTDHTAWVADRMQDLLDEDNDEETGGRVRK
jgi:hypothetical protein